MKKSHSKFMEDAKSILQQAKSEPVTAERAIELAAFMIEEAKRIQTWRERSLQAQLARMMNDPIGKVFLTSMTDQCFRCKSSGRVADQLVYLIKKFGIPRFFSNIKRLGLAGFFWLGRPLAGLLVPLVKWMVQRETSSVILPGEAKQLSKHLTARRQEGVNVNLNHLGEAILGEEEAKHRLSIYLKDLANPEIECISIKISTIYSQINLLSRQETLAVLSERLRRLYRCARDHQFVRSDGTSTPKFVNLDMEEYRDLYLTVELFKSVLDDPEFLTFSAGIVLQSYLPDSFSIQQELTQWAKKRLAKGGASVKIRIVKGANLAMEQVESSLRGWPQAPYRTKAEVDVNFKRMVDFGCEPSNAEAVHLGIASHNLFDIAYALLLRSHHNVERQVCFEMLEGMADHQRRVVQQLSHNMLLYCPAAERTEFQNAVAYLVRRLDENTAPENFLRDAFEMVPGNKTWQIQKVLFSRACDPSEHVGTNPQRFQNRQEEPRELSYNGPFENEADTDWALVKNCEWALNILEEWKTKKIPTIPLSIGDEEISDHLPLGEGKDPSNPNQTLYHYALAGDLELEKVLQESQKGAIAWAKRPLKERLLILHEVAHALRCGRGMLVGAMVADTGKTAFEADVEISEAIDFVEYYRRNVEELHQMRDIEWSPKGPILVASPWNFPCSIPVGGIAAALAGGNSVIFKPAPEAVLVGWQLANLFWEAGVDRNVLQFFCCEDDSIGSKLIQDSRLKAVILTGATSTAKLFLRLHPGLDLMAETGGKNALIITGMSDRDLAIKDLVQSAFGHAGQKCSACSLAILEKEVYDDPHFRKQLHDAASSLKVGVAWNPATKVNPLIREPNADLLRGLTKLEEGEEWLLKPQQDPNNPQLWSPGIKLGVKAGSFMHQTELFGPVLGVMRARNLEEAIALANATPYGLTSGIHSLDEREHTHWLKKIVVGNCYINRGITGAIVRRQPFGGCKESSFGPGAKAGGPNYLMQMMIPQQKSWPSEREGWNTAVKRLQKGVKTAGLEKKEMDLWETSAGNYAFHWIHYFSKEQDPSQLRGQDNLLRYVPHPYQVVRIQANDWPLDVWRILAAALTCKAKVELSLEPGVFLPLKPIRDICKIVMENEDQLIARLKREKKPFRMRLLASGSLTLHEALGKMGANVIVAPILANGRIELLHWLREISISYDYHRYGYLGEREK